MMVRYRCPRCDHLWKGLSRKPGGRVWCPKCNALVYEYAKVQKPTRVKTPTPRTFDEFPPREAEG